MQLMLNGVWGAFCYDNWNDDIASVTCRHLGFTGVIRSYEQLQTEMLAAVSWKANITCQGDETKLDKCKVNGVKLGKCQRNIVSIKCRSGKVYVLKY